jgi:hypothetical protein
MTPSYPARTAPHRSDAYGRAGSAGQRKWRRRRLLVTTKTEEKAIAAPAIIG